MAKLVPTEDALQNFFDAARGSDGKTRLVGLVVRPTLEGITDLIDTRREWALAIGQWRANVPKMKLPPLCGACDAEIDRSPGAFLILAPQVDPSSQITISGICHDCSKLTDEAIMIANNRYAFGDDPGLTLTPSPFGPEKPQ